LKEYPKGKFWENFTDDQLSELENEIFRDLRASGFPHPVYTILEKIRDFECVKKSGSALPLIEDGIIRQTMQGLKVLWPYFPHHINVKCGKLMSPAEAFADDKMLIRAIRQRLRIGTYVTASGFRKSIKTIGSCQGVSNFRPTAAKAIYDYFGGGVVYDMSSGYGGRMLGAMASDKVTKYIGCEPEQATYNGLCAVSYDLSGHHTTSIELNQIGSEDFIPTDPVDICFTSPPYFGHEQYGYGEMQSFVKFKKKEDWFNGFLTQTVQNCISCLKPGGTLVLNISNVNSYSELEKDFLNYMAKTDMIRMPDLKLSLSRMPTKNKKTKKYKYEMVYVFKKWSRVSFLPKDSFVSMEF